MTFDGYVDGGATDCTEGAVPRETRAGLRLRAATPLASAMAGEGTRASRCRMLRALPRAGGMRSREIALLAAVRALDARDPEIRVAALDGLFALAQRSPRLRERIHGLLERASLARSRSTAMHAAVLCAAVESMSSSPVAGDPLSVDGGRTSRPHLAG